MTQEWQPTDPPLQFVLKYLNNYWIAMNLAAEKCFPAWLKGQIKIRFFSNLCLKKKKYWTVLPLCIPTCIQMKQSFYDWMAYYSQ